MAAFRVLPITNCTVTPLKRKGLFLLTPAAPSRLTPLAFRGVYRSLYDLWSIQPLSGGRKVYSMSRMNALWGAAALALIALAPGPVWAGLVRYLNRNCG